MEPPDSQKPPDALGIAGAGRLLKQLSLERLSDNSQLQDRFAADEAFFDQLHLLQALDELLRQSLVSGVLSAAGQSLEGSSNGSSAGSGSRS
jgi:hypothetical protein